MSVSPRSHPATSARPGLAALARVVAGCAVLALVLAGCGDDSAGPPRTMIVVGSEMAFSAPSSTPPGDYTVTFTNTGSVEHELVFTNPAGKRVIRAGAAPGETTTLKVQLRPGTWELSCHEPGHFEAGMHAKLVVEKA